MNLAKIININIGIYAGITILLILLVIAAFKKKRPILVNTRRKAAEHPPVVEKRVEKIPFPASDEEKIALGLLSVPIEQWSISDHERSMFIYSCNETIFTRIEGFLLSLKVEYRFDSFNVQTVTLLAVGINSNYTGIRYNQQIIDFVKRVYSYCVLIERDKKAVTKKRILDVLTQSPAIPKNA